MLTNYINEKWQNTNASLYSNNIWCYLKQSATGEAAWHTITFQQFYTEVCVDDCCQPSNFLNNVVAVWPPNPNVLFIA
jgi:hypothetical protein